MTDLTGGVQTAGSGQWSGQGWGEKGTLTLTQTVVHHYTTTPTTTLHSQHSHSVVFRVLMITSEQGENTGLDDTHGMVGRFLDEFRECWLQRLPDTLVL